MLGVMCTCLPKVFYESRAMSLISIRLMRSLVSLLMVVIITAIDVSIAQADANYERAEPPAAAVIPVAPSEVHVWFTQELFRRASENTLEVIGPDGSRVDTEDVQMDDDDRTHLFVSLADDLPPGLYTVRWRALSADDGHSSQGEFSFTVDPEAAPAAETTITDTTAITSMATPEVLPTEPAVPTPLPPSPTVSETPSAASESPASSGSWPCLGSASLGLASLTLVYTRRSRYPWRH
jgi:methionine-rich copper-binding protein CopC